MSTIERMLRAGTITTEQFWCANHFAACHEAFAAGPGVQARGFNERFRGTLVTQSPTHHQTDLLVAEWNDLCAAMQQAMGKERSQRSITVLTMVCARGVSLTSIDEALRQAKGLASDTCVEGLRFLEKLWSYEIAMQLRQASKGMETSARA